MNSSEKEVHTDTVETGEPPLESLKKEKANWMVERWLRERAHFGYGSKVKRETKKKKKEEL